jgi:hypothetical protein
MQSPEERINIIRQAVNHIQVNDDGLDLNNVSFAEISDIDNEGLTNAAKEYINEPLSDN